MQLSTVADRRIHTPLSEQSTSLAVRSDRRRLREVSVAEREQPDSLSMLLTTRWMNQYVWELRFYFLLTRATTALGHAPKCWYWFFIYRKHMWTAQLNSPRWAELKFFYFPSYAWSVRKASRLASFSVRAADLYVLFIGLGWLKLAHSFVTAVCLGAESDPRVNINMAFSRAAASLPSMVNQTITTLARERGRDGGRLWANMEGEMGRWEHGEDIG